MAAGLISPREVAGVVLVVLGALLSVAGAVSLALAIFFMLVEQSMSLGHIPGIFVVVQGLVMLACGVLVFRKGRKIYGTVAS